MSLDSNGFEWLLWSDRAPMTDEQAQRRTVAAEAIQHRPTARHTVARKPR